MMLGGVNSAARTAEQTEVGLFWAYDRLGMGTPMVLYNDIMRTVAVDQGNTLEQNAQMFALATVAMADAGVVAWDSKFEYDLWRPVTGIRQGNLDGNDDTVGDENWTPLGAPDGEDIVGFTPPFPTYLSGHATFGGALFATLIEFYGTDDITFTVSSEELQYLLDNPDLMAAYGLDLDDTERTFSSFSEAMAENGRSRVYLGIHWNYDDTVAQETGTLVAQAIANGEFIAIPEPTSLVALLLLGLPVAGRALGRRRRV
ncbi:vanadium-dependent haloperoxidase [Phycisphaeraceae bacterium D3-23]